MYPFSKSQCISGSSLLAASKEWIDLQEHNLSPILEMGKTMHLNSHMDIRSHRFQLVFCPGSWLGDAVDSVAVSIAGERKIVNEGEKNKRKDCPKG